MQKNSNYQRISVYLGNVFEHYDTALMSLLAPFIATLFFPNHDRLTALIMTYGLIPLGMLIRPVGALYFGYLGDNNGRNTALFISLIGMAISTSLIALTPTYHTIGVMAPLLLIIFRISQNFFASGEQQGGAIYLLENSSEKKADMVSSFFNVSTVIGILIASLLVSLFCYLDIISRYWRALFALGSLTAVFGCFIRRGLLKRDDQADNNIEKKNDVLEHLKSLTNMPKEAIALFFAGGFSYATYSMALVLINGFVPLISNISESKMMFLNSLLLTFDILTLPLFGRLAKKISRKKMMIISSTLSFTTSIPLFYLLEGATLPAVIIIRLILVTLGVSFSATLHSWAQNLVPRNRRYTFISFYIALGSQILGAPTSSISLMLYKQTNAVYSVGLYWAALGLITSLLLAGVKVQATLKKEHVETSFA